MTEKEIVDKVHAVYATLEDQAGDPDYYNILKKMVIAINKELCEENIDGLTRFQKIHLFSWSSNFINACEFALLIKEEPTMLEEKRLIIQEMIANLLQQASKYFNMSKNLKAFNEAK